MEISWIKLKFTMKVPIAFVIYAYVYFYIYMFMNIHITFLLACINKKKNNIACL